MAGGGSGGLVGTPIEFLLKEYEVKLGNGKRHGHANRIRTSWNLFYKTTPLRKGESCTNYQVFDAGGVMFGFHLVGSLLQLY